VVVSLPHSVRTSPFVRSTTRLLGLSWGEHKVLEVPVGELLGQQGGAQEEWAGDVEDFMVT